MDRDAFACRLALAQGAYFALTGLWPLIHMPSFLAVTGPKTDLWLVDTVAVLVLAVGVALLVAGATRRIGPDTRVLAVGSALGLAGIDVVFTLDGTIRAVYLLDAAVELALVAAWVATVAVARPSRAPA